MVHATLVIKICAMEICNKDISTLLLPGKETCNLDNASLRKKMSESMKPILRAEELCRYP